MEKVQEELNLLLSRNIIYKIEIYYLKINSPDLIQKRLNGNIMAKKVKPKALRMANKIAQFPFVRGVAFSGAFSKGYFDKEGDIDFFIITEHKRLWLARTILILYKKIFLLNSKKYFCVNYFITEKNLNISEKNKFTAMELVTLIPTHGKKLFYSFYKANLWITHYFPNVNTSEKLLDTKEIKPIVIKEILEFMLDSKLGIILNSIFHKITLKKWESKFSHLPKEEFKVAMKSDENVSKHHPRNFQKQIIDTLNAKYFQISKKHNINLDPEHA
jgi:hypothetical protein